MKIDVQIRSSKALIDTVCKRYRKAKLERNFRSAQKKLKGGKGKRGKGHA